MKRTALILLLALALVPSLAAQPATCAPPTNSFVKIPELAASGNTLKGTIVFSAENQCLPTRVPATAQAPASTYTWAPQFVRIARGAGALPAAPPPVNGMNYPLPGPTLRARVGDLVQLTLLNQIDPNDFPYSIDQGEKSPQGGCDQTSLYPGTGPNADKFPDCFHGSSTVNIHFHGTHTNPNSTGDNVFLEIRPSPRTRDAQDAPIVTQATVQQPFDEFFAKCSQELPVTNQLRQWPFTWADLPASWTTTQEALIKEYDKTAGRTLWPTNARQLAMGAWPQYYIGAYPYCYRIPAYTGTTWPPANGSAAHAAHTAGAGAAEQPASTSSRPLQMGQSPGTHWYHAHKHGSTAINVANGLTGVFIIEGQYDDDLNAFYGKDWTKKAPVMVINQLGVGPNLERGGGGQNAAGLNLGPDKGPSLAVNGRIAPQMTMAPGEVQLWRIVNTSGRAGVYFDGPPAGFQWMQLAQDGVQFSDANYKQTLNRPFLLASGNRADILVMAPAKANKTAFSFMVQNAVDQSDIFGPGAQPQNTLLSVLVTGSAATGNTTKFIPNAPAFPPFLADITAAEVKGTQELVFTSEFPGNGPPPSVHSINGQEFSGEVGEVVLLNEVQEWKVSNATNASTGPAISHPFHIHINPFQVVEEFAPNSYLIDPKTNEPVVNPATKAPYQVYVFDKTTPLVQGQCYVDPNDPSTWKPCSAVPPPANIWWDVFPIPTGTGAKDANGNPVTIPGYFKMRSRFVDYSGYYVIHCHILAHEDRGMMTVVQVAPLQSPYSHH